MLNNIAVVESNQEGGELGHLFWYSIGEDLYPRQKLESSLNKCGLSARHMPNEVRLVDAFRRATKEVETRINQGKGITENYLVRDVSSNRELVIRHIVLETIDSNGRKLSYNEEEAVMKLDKINDSIDIKAIIGSTAEGLGNEAKKYYEIFKENHNGAAVRTMIQNMLWTLSPTPVRTSGGIYFIPSAQTEGLAKLVAFCSSFDKGEGYKVPVVESKESLKMISTKVADHLDSILNQCKGALKDDTLTPYRLKELTTEARNVVSGFKDYEQILFKQKDEMEARVQFIREAMTLLFDKAA